MYGSSFCIVTVWPRAWRSLARDAETIPLPKDEVTPPVTNMYLVFSFMPVSLRETKIDQRSFGEGIIIRTFQRADSTVLLIKPF
jgi:hypothetical protein